MLYQYGSFGRHMQTLLKMEVVYLASPALGILFIASFMAPVTYGLLT